MKKVQKTGQKPCGFGKTGLDWSDGMNRNTFIFRSVVLTAALMCAISVSAQRYGNMMGGGMGAMAALNELTNAGLDMDGVQSVVKELVSYAKEKAGDDVVNEVVSQIPGLSQIV